MSPPEQSQQNDGTLIALVRVFGLNDKVDGSLESPDSIFPRVVCTFAFSIRSSIVDYNDAFGSRIC